VEAFSKDEADAPAESGKNKPFRQLLIVMEKGLGKRTKLSEYPLQKRAGQGVKVAEVTPKTGEVVAAMMVTHLHEEVVITTQSGQMIKMEISNACIPVLTRPTQGVILMRPKAGDKVVAVALTTESQVEEAVADKAEAEEK
jgi:DNA gyrase subunit A